MTFLVSIDGMRPDSLQIGRTPNLDAMIAEGAWARRARTLMPCCTLPCHTSMFRGVEPARHGINGNVFQPLVRPVPSVVDQIHAHGLRAGAFFNWGPLRDLYDPESVAASLYLRDAHRAEGDAKVADAAIRYCREEALDFAFVYLGWTDECGHLSGWMSEPYLDAVSHADECVGRLRAAFPEADFLVLSDHGGHDRTHGTECEQDMNIVWIGAGPNFASAIIEEEVMIHQTPATLAHAMGVSVPREWDGARVRAALRR